MSSLGNARPSENGRTVDFPLPVAPMMLMNGMVDGRESTRTDDEDVRGVSNGNDAEWTNYKRDGYFGCILRRLGRHRL